MSKYEQIAHSIHDAEAIRGLIVKGFAKGPVLVSLSRPKRTKDQNRLLWPLLRDCSQQIDYHGMKLSESDWKDLMTVGFEGAQRSAPSLDGNGLVFFGISTSEYPKDTFSALIEFIYSEGSERGVIWSKQSEENLKEVRG